MTDDQLPAYTAAERARALRDRGVAAEDAALLATLTSGRTPPSVLLAEALAASGLNERAVAERVAGALGVDALPGAAPRITRYLAAVREARGNQAARLAPRAVEAIASVLGASRDAFVRSFEAAAAAIQPGAGTSLAGALAREGRDDVLLDADRAREDDDEIDALFNRPLG